MNANSLLGNERAYATLAAYLRGERLPHALLLEGPTGCGKLTFAREVAAAALCIGDGSDKPCGECASCLKATKQIHPDITLYQGAGGARSFHVDAVREIRRDAFVSPNEAETKVLLLRNVQEMTIQAQNALLKIIEEPPATAMFVLTCENKAALLGTILSRVAVISLELPAVEQAIQALTVLEPEADAEKLRESAIAAAGNVGVALGLLRGESDQLYKDSADILARLIKGDEFEALATLAKYEKDRPGYTALVRAMGAAAAAAALEAGRGNATSAQKNSAGVLQLSRIVDIMEELAGAAAGNISGLLLVNILCAKVREALL